MILVKIKNPNQKKKIDLILIIWRWMYLDCNIARAFHVADFLSVCFLSGISVC